MNSNALNTLWTDKKQGMILFSLLLILVLRFAFIGLMGLMPQDAYYFFYSEHPALSYYDHPPLDRAHHDPVRGGEGRRRVPSDRPGPSGPPDRARVERGTAVGGAHDIRRRR